VQIPKFDAKPNPKSNPNPNHTSHHITSHLFVSVASIARFHSAYR